MVVVVLVVVLRMTLIIVKSLTDFEEFMDYTLVKFYIHL